MGVGDGLIVHPAEGKFLQEKVDYLARLVALSYSKFSRQ
jgi:hypothetical protein